MTVPNASSIHGSGRVLAVEEIQSGLNNQRIVLLGLLHLAKEKDARARLPDLLTDFTPRPRPRIDGRREPDATFPIGSIFDEESLKELLARHSLDTRKAPTELVSVKAAFAAGVAALKRLKALSEPDGNDLTCSFFQHVKAAPQIRSISSFFSREILALGSVGLQLRVERDWQNHLARKKVNLISESEEIPIHPHRILEKVAFSKQINVGTPVLLCCNEEDLLMPRERIKEMGAALGLTTYFKSDLESSPLLPGSRLQRAMVEFEACLELRRYIGLTRSTFSNMLATIGWCRGSSAQHFIYNGRVSSIQTRHDRGLSVSPAAATQPDQK